MGLERSIYLGPYLACRVEQAGSTKSIRACHNPTCKQRDKQYYAHSAQHRYCNACGQSITAKEVPIREDRVKSGEACQVIAESLHVVDDYAANVARWLPNVQREGCPREFIVDDDEVIAFGGNDPSSSLTVVDPPAEMDWFALAYLEEIKVFRGLYGIDNVSVAWGLISHTG